MRANKPSYSRVLKCISIYWPILLLVAVYTSFWIFWKPQQRVPPKEAHITQRQLFKMKGDEYIYDPDQPYQAFDIPEWLPERVHPRPNYWRKCVLEEFPGFPSVNSTMYDTQRPVLIHTWHTLKKFMYIHKVSVLHHYLILLIRIPSNSVLYHAFLLPNSERRIQCVSMKLMPLYHIPFLVH